MREFLVPRYFPAFRCKMGACRRSCCEGWPITVSMQNYFRLLGLSCSHELRRRLDTALRLVEHPTEEEYARFTPNWLGDCPMRMEDGRCSLHAELGEEVLSDVCRLYPRGVREAVDPASAPLECSASNSCEAAVELLMREKEPMTFEVRSLSVEPPPFPGKPSIPPSVSEPGKLRFSLIRAMQNRDRTLEERLGDLYEVLGAPRQTKGFAQVGLKLLASLDESSDSLRGWADLLAERCRGGSRAAEEDVRRFRETVPDADILFEQLLVNHMFFTQFPFHGLPPEEEADALFGVSAMLVTLVSCAYAAGEPEEAAKNTADAAAALFRLVEHTCFYENYHRTWTRSARLPSN